MVSGTGRPKRQDVFIKATGEVVKIYSDVSAVIVGETKIAKSENYLKELYQLINELFVTDKVIFRDFVENMKKLYAS